MPTYRDLFEKLGTLSPDQLDSEIKIITAGYPDETADSLLNAETIPHFLELTKAARDYYHYTPSGEDTFEEAGVVDFSADEVKELGIDTDEDYKLICKKGEIILKLKDNIYMGANPESHIGNLETSILHL
ncbi:MAG: hypothetical protein Q4G10_04435 [Bacteroidia bacterium]|nr:hypothetical protein [Bacteroidia bacterium]